MMMTVLRIIMIIIRLIFGEGGGLEGWQKKLIKSTDVTDASIKCWRTIFSTSCYPHIVPMMNQ